MKLDIEIALAKGQHFHVPRVSDYERIELTMITGNPFLVVLAFSTQLRLANVHPYSACPPTQSICMVQSMLVCSSQSLSHDVAWILYLIKSNELFE